MIEWVFESLFATFVLMLNIFIGVIVGGFFINLWEVMLDRWNRVFKIFW